MQLQSKTLHSALINFLLGSLILVFFTIDSAAQEKVTTPENFFGFKMGSDRKLARWDRIVDYFYKLEKESDRIKVINMGPSTMGNPFLVLVISSPENLSNLDRLQEINKKISDPRGIDEKTIESYIKEGKAVICQSMGLHASEVGGTQMTPELTYDLVSRKDTETQRILDNVLFFMIPCFNPDGEIMITDWYNETVGTDYEGARLPWLYNKYAGHDNNRDGDFLNLAESKYAAKIMYVDWPPQAYIDHHQMGSYGARFYVPPYCEPIRPYADPLIWREISWYGSHIAYKLEEAGIKGVINSAMFPGWGHFGWHWITPFHNITGMLTESASVNLATPIYIHPEQLRAGSRQFPEYKAQSTFPSPWPGGWWRLEDIVRQKKVSA
ncbi:peptidase M14 family protein, partial [bacterium]|nr:peptidase M14 family protein [bacterium]